MNKKYIFATMAFWFAVTTTAINSASYAADLTNGKALYENPNLGGGKSGKTCKTCHEDGRDLSRDLLTKKEFQVMGITMKNVQEVVNFCIEVTLRGEEIAPDSKEMNDLIHYLHYLANKKSPSPGSGKGLKDS